MKVVSLYRYPHPVLPDRWLYVGQGADRDKRHRSGKSSFGRRFKKLFPDALLPEPVRWIEPAADHLEANEAETVAMFRFRTWRGYPSGMNLTFPGSKNYVSMGCIAGQAGSHEDKVKAGRAGGLISGKITREGKLGVFRLTLKQMKENGHRGGTTSGNIHKINGTGICGLTLEQRSENGRKGGSITGRMLKERGLGIFGLTREQHKSNSRLGGKKGGTISGRMNAENGHLAKLRTPEHQLKAARLGGLIGGKVVCCLRWNIRRGKPCTCGKHSCP